MLFGVWRNFRSQDANPTARAGHEVRAAHAPEGEDGEFDHREPAYLIDGDSS